MFYGTAPALADLDGDGLPDVVLQTNTQVYAWKGDGTPLPGWPVTIGPGTWLSNASPVVGDLDGDGRPEVVALSLPAGLAGASGDVLVFSALGVRLTALCKHLPIDDAAVPAIADIDQDGRNDLIITADYWDGHSGYHDKVWAFDFRGPTPYGPVQWGQFMGGPKHQGRYDPATSGPPAGYSSLSVSKVGDGAGTVTSSPAGISCGSACGALFATGTSVVLTAVPATDSVFTGWSGACTGTGTCSVVVSSMLTVVATFTKITYPLTVSVTGNGTVTSSPSGISSCGSVCQAAFPAGTIVSLIATPQAGYVFDGWTGACTYGMGGCSVTMDGPRSVGAAFIPAAGPFTQAFSLAGMDNGDAAWADYDRSGRLDLAVVGQTVTGSATAAKLYRNTGTQFVDTSVGLLAGDSFAAWGDYDNDGDLDVAISGYFGLP